MVLDIDCDFVGVMFFLVDWLRFLNFSDEDCFGIVKCLVLECDLVFDKLWCLCLDKFVLWKVWLLCIEEGLFGVVGMRGFFVK